MGIEYNSAAEAQAKGSLCNFQLEFSFSFEISLPQIPIPDFDIELPKISLFCPLD